MQFKLLAQAIVLFGIADLAASSCPNVPGVYSTTWTGGGCQWYDTPLNRSCREICINQASGRRCCSGVETSLDPSGCLPTLSICRCTCQRLP
ncbi:hypothetical protein QBC34DRAFT_417821 [Podospora aff. communis PSN243]|uniref:Uncharacterized protein n=1 Tax=Podospora aff. communis PSN243 TaxID=3040156 RepID=A0AAV9G799_9PEZI|nr:hypothetical protein QBC34DRAFT_417821 [Podospora aff. communis PSN243]